MSSPYVKPTLQAAFLSAVSNILAQILTVYKSNKPFELDLTQLVQFVCFSLLSTPPNIAWQELLERTYPARAPSRPVEKGKDSEKKTIRDDAKEFSVANTAKKFFLDQTVGALFNTVAFIVGIGFLRGKDTATISADLQNDFWPIVQTGLKVWPLVSLFNFILVPVEKRVIVGGLVGIGWGVYLSLLAA